MNDGSLDPRDGTAGSGAGSDARTRRAERARFQGRRQLLTARARPFAVAAAIVLVAVLAWAGLQALPDDAPADEYRVKIHRHAGFKVFLDDEAVSFRHCAFDLTGCRDPSDGKSYPGSDFKGAHLHMDEPYDSVLHMEYTLVAGARNVTLRDFFEEHDMNITDTSIMFNDVVHAGRGEVANNATHVWQLWVSHCFVEPQQWTREAKIADYNPLQHDRFVLGFQPLGTGADDLAQQFDQVPTDPQIAEVGYDSCPTLRSTITSSAASG